MQTIELNCFQDSELCFYISDFKNFQINNEIEEHQLKINNLSNKDCELMISLESNDPLAQELELTVFSKNELFFKEILGKDGKNLINLNRISKNSSKSYDFDFKIIENEGFSYEFDLILTFSCVEDSNLEEVQSMSSSSTKVSEKSRAEILGQNTVAVQEKIPEENLEKNIKFVFIPYLILLVFLIFVIMFFVNGKKKKKNHFKKKKGF